MCAIAERLRDERGVGVVAVIFVILILSLLGTVMVTLTVEEMSAGLRHVQGEQAIMAAEAGLEYAQKLYAADNTWTGLAEPGRAVGLGHFIVVVNTTDGDGTTVAAGTKVLHAIGIVGGARREIVTRAVTTSGSPTATTLYARAEGNALNLGAPNALANPANMLDADGTNGTFASGDWANEQQILATSWQGGAVAGTITKVEVLISGYLTAALSDDYAQVRMYLNNAPSGAAVTISAATLNARVGIGSMVLTPWTVDVTAVRTWTAADFSGDLELWYGNVLSGTDDGMTVNIDAVAFRVTTTVASTTFESYREVIS